MMQYKNIDISALQSFPLRNLRQPILDKIETRIKDSGYNPARPLSVFQKDNQFYVADGNHRLHVLHTLKIESVPCVIYEDVDPYTLAVKCNQDEDTYAPMDVFDWVDLISKMKSDGLTQAAIGDRIGWSESKTMQYSALLKNTLTDVLILAQTYQEGRVSDNLTNVSFNFTEGWFRNSGIYDLNEEHQMALMEWFLDEEKGKASNKKIREKVEYFKNIESQIALIDELLSPEIESQDLRDAVLRGEYNDKRLQEVISRLNEGAKNRAIFGIDALEGLRSLPANSIDLVVTDPPYGVDYVPSRKTGNPRFHDKKEDVLAYLDLVFAEIKRVCKENAHIYCFSGWMNLFEVRELLKQYFHVPYYTLTWKKNNHTPCDFKTEYASNDEQIIFCKMPNGDERKLNAPVSRRVIDCAIPQNKTHDCQKPVELLKALIENSSGQNEVVLDPFAGSGSTLLAAAESGRYYIGFEIETKYEPEFKRSLP